MPGARAACAVLSEAGINDFVQVALRELAVRTTDRTR